MSGESISFAQPLWFWGFAAFPFLVALFFFNESRRETLLRKLVAARLQPRLAGTVSIGRRRLQFALVLLGLGCLLVSLAQPRLGYTWEQSKRKGRDVLIAIDTSRSMLATDLTPNRLTRAKLAAQDLIGALDGDRVGLIAFAGTAFLQAPLTADYAAVLGALNELDTEIIPQGGTNLAAAMQVAEESFGKGEGEHRCLIIFSDGEEIDADGVKRATEQKEKIRIFTVGLGSPEGSLIPVAQPGGGTDFVKDPGGQIVKSRLDEERLRKIAEVTGGFYVHLQSGPAEMKQIVRDGLLKMSEHDIDAKLSRQPIERYQWPLGAAIVLLMAAFCINDRKRGTALQRQAIAAAALVIASLMTAPLGQAKNSGVEAYERKDFGGARDIFSKQLQRQPKSDALQFDLGSAAYKQGDLDKALEAFAKSVTSNDPKLRALSEYNLANTLFQRGVRTKNKEPKIQEWTNALQHYDEALKLQPQNGDARYNRDLVAKLIADLQKEPPKPEEKKPEEQKGKDPKSDKGKQQEQQSGKDQQEKQSGKPEQKDGEQKDEQPGESKEEQGKNSDGNKEEQASGGAKDSPQKPDGAGEKKEGQQQDGTDSPQQPTDAKQGGEQGDRKLSGEMKTDGAPPVPDAEQLQAVEEANAAAKNEMTEAQARMLLESMRGEEERVKLLQRNERKGAAAHLKDW